MDWLDDIILGNIDELYSSEHIVLSHEPPRPIRYREETVLPSQYSDVIEEEGDTPLRPDLAQRAITQLISQVDSTDWTDKPIKEKLKSDDTMEDIVVISKNFNLDPSVPEYVPKLKESIGDTVAATKTDISQDRCTGEGDTTAGVTTTVPQRKGRNMAMQSLLKLRELHGIGNGEAGGARALSPTAVRLRRPEDFLSPGAPVEIVSQPPASLPKPRTAPAEPRLHPQHANVELESQEKVRRWLDDKKSEQVPIPAKRATPVSLLTSMAFVPKVSPGASDEGSLQTPAETPAHSPLPAGRGPKEFVASDNARALYEKYNRNKKLMTLAEPAAGLNGRRDNTLWANISKKLVEHECKKEDLIDRL